MPADRRNTEMWDVARRSTLCRDLHLECADVLEQRQPDIWCAARQQRVRVGADAWLDYAGSFAEVLCSELHTYSEKILQGELKPLRGNIDRLKCGTLPDAHQPDIWCAARQQRVRVGADAWLDYAGSFAEVLCSELHTYSEKILQGELKPLRGNIDRLVGGNATTQITDFLLALKTVDRFAATNRSTLLQVPSFPCKLTMDKRTAEYMGRLNKWPNQLRTLKRAFDEHTRTVYNGTHLVQAPIHQDLSHLGLEGRDVMLLMEYQTHALQSHWMSVASLVDGLAIFIRSLLLHKGAMSDTYVSRLNQVMQQNGLGNSVSAMLGAGRLKRRLTDWKAAFGAAMFISPLVIFCGEGLGQVCALIAAIKVCGLKGRGSGQAVDGPVS
ncbi:hypothetical protein ARMSODRAFT_1019744 [Armillaria solidipes]|uniref:Uncharacterized protein n=1 Tax=Armillaria solidipes TaxID=1076256 RepID=A0A2H3BG32_9AGAR|nr:hypothetical protein ARMSODRAFT_1019744 [Armillaria solidipes]